MQPSKDINQKDVDTWVFTFCGDDRKRGGYYVTFDGTYYEARAKMLEKYGTYWAFQYSSIEWKIIMDRARWDGRTREKPLPEDLRR